MATLFGNEKNFRTQKVLATARLSKTSIKICNSHPPKDKFPFPITPAYENGQECLFSAAGICWAVASAEMRGKDTAAAIQWLTSAEDTFLPAVLGWVLPSLSFMHNDKKAVEGSKAELEGLLTALDGFLLPRTFLVCERLSVADVSLAFNLLPAYEAVLEPGVRKQFVNVTRWFNTVMQQPDVKAVVGDVKLCEQAAQFDGKKFKEMQGGEEKGGKKEKKEQPKKETQKKKKEEKPPEEEEEEMDETEAALAAEPKKKDPFDQFDKGNFIMDEFKRVYSNEDTLEKALPYFWEHFEPDKYSIWYCEYSYPKELTLVFMSCNLISGMFQRLDKMRKNAFGSMILFGSDNNSTISGVWFWRGPELAFTLTPDWMIDFDSYSWTKLEPADPKTKQLVKEYFAWEGEFDGKQFNQGKIFK